MNLFSVLFKNLIGEFILRYPTICPTTYSLEIPVKQRTNEKKKVIANFLGLATF